MKIRNHVENVSLLGRKRISAKSLVRLEIKRKEKDQHPMFPLLFLVYVVAIKVFKKTTPNGKSLLIGNFVSFVGSILQSFCRTLNKFYVKTSLRQNYGVPGQERFHRPSRLHRSNRRRHRCGE